MTKCFIISSAIVLLAGCGSNVATSPMLNTTDTVQTKGVIGGLFGKLGKVSGTITSIENSGGSIRINVKGIGYKTDLVGNCASDHKKVELVILADSSLKVFKCVPIDSDFGPSGPGTGTNLYQCAPGSISDLKKGKGIESSISYSLLKGGYTATKIEVGIQPLVD